MQVLIHTKQQKRAEILQSRYNHILRIEHKIPEHKQQQFRELKMLISTELNDILFFCPKYDK